MHLLLKCLGDSQWLPSCPIMTCSLFACEAHFFCLCDADIKCLKHMLLQLSALLFCIEYIIAVTGILSSVRVHEFCLLVVQSHGTFVASRTHDE